MHLAGWRRARVATLGVWPGTLSTPLPLPAAMGSGALVGALALYVSLDLDLPAPLRPEPQCVLVAVSGTLDSSSFKGAWFEGAWFEARTGAQVCIRSHALDLGRLVRVEGRHRRRHLHLVIISNLQGLIRPMVQYREAGACG